MNLPNTICEGIVRLACKYGLSRVVLFGSRARGQLGAQRRRSRGCRRRRCALLARCGRRAADAFDVRCRQLGWSCAAGAFGRDSEGWCFAL